MTKDTASIRDVYQAISDMRKEMQEMKRELKEDAKLSMDSHCKWAENIVKESYKVIDEYDKRIDGVETWQSSLNGKMAVVGGIIMFVMSIVSAFIVKSIEQVFAKG